MDTSITLLAQQVTAPLLDPPTRAVLLMSLLAFVILGLGLMVGAALGGRWVRRLGGDKPPRPLPLRRPPELEESAVKQRPAVLRSGSPSGDTARIEAAVAETRLG